jgi:hypothetical protein
LYHEKHNSDINSILLYGSPRSISIIFYIINVKRRKARSIEKISAPVAMFVYMYIKDTVTIKASDMHLIA